MKRMMKIELRRAFTSPGCVLALILGCLIAAVHWALFVLPLSSTLEDYVEMNKAMMYPGWLYTSWIGSDTTAIPAYLLFLILPINDKVEQLYYHTFFIGLMLILTGFLLFVADKMPKGTRTEKNMRVRDALIIGVCQAVATIPGLSRSGTTIAAGMATGLDRSFAVRFSFLMSLPAVLGANILSLAKAAKTGIDVSLLPAYLIGMFVAMVSGIAAIGLVKRLTSKGRFGAFSYYCWGAGALTMILSLIF